MKQLMISAGVVCLLSLGTWADDVLSVERGNILAFDGIPLRLSPVSGYVNEHYIGVKGLQKQYDEHLNSGKNLVTTIHAKFQKDVENIVDTMASKLYAEEILVMVMDSHTGKLLTIATSKRYDPEYITQKDIEALKPKFMEYLFEPGSLMKPVTVAIALDNGVVNLDTPFQSYNGKLSMGKDRYIKDNLVLDDNMTIEDIIVKSSNIGITQVAWLLTAQEFREGLMAFSFGKKSGIDLSYDLSGQIKSEEKLENKLHRANTAYGYGMLATMTQLLKAYSVFVNKGIMITPHIVTGETYIPQKVISPETAKKVKNILIEVVKRGAGRKAKRRGLIIGGETGTAHIAKDGKYTNTYNSTFFGFVEGKFGNSYTIGVLVIDAKGKNKYFASQSAVPTFRKIVEAMLKNGLLESSDLLEEKGKQIYIGEKTFSPLPGGTLLEKYGVYTDKTYDIKVFRESITLKAAQENTSVFNVCDGKVIFSGDIEFLGKVVMVGHGDTLITIYAHLSKIAPGIVKDKRIKKGLVLGRVDRKLMFQVNEFGMSVNPLDLVDLNKGIKYDYK